jgi:hypothetical protein
MVPAAIISQIRRLVAVAYEKLDFSDFVLARTFEHGRYAGAQAQVQKISRRRLSHGGLSHRLAE